MMRKTIFRNSLWVCLVFLCMPSLAFRSVLRDREIEIPVPDEWRKATQAEIEELLTAEYGIVYKPNVMSPPLIDISSKRVRSFMFLSAGLIGLGSGDRGTEDKLRIIGASLKRKINDTPPLEKNRICLRDYKEGENYVGVECRMTVVPGPSFWLYNGVVLLDDHIYEVNVLRPFTVSRESLFSQTDGDELSDMRRKYHKEVETWHKLLVEANNEKKNIGAKTADADALGAIRSQPMSYDRIEDKLSDGDNARNNELSLIGEREVDDILQGKWSYIELAEGMKIALPDEPNRVNVRKMPSGGVEASYSKMMGGGAVFVQMLSTMIPVDKCEAWIAKTLRASCYNDQAVRSKVEEMVTTDHIKVLDVGEIALEDGFGIWYTVSAENEEEGLNVSALMRTCKIPIGRRFVMSCVFGVASIDIGRPPTCEFEALSPVGMRLARSVTLGGNAVVQKLKRTFEATGSGTGWFVDGEHVITCYHVVKDVDAIVFERNDKSLVYLEVVGKDEHSDIAVLKVQDADTRCPSPLQIAKAMPSVGEGVATVGFPIPLLLGENAKLTTGIINADSGLMGDSDFFQISAQVQPGNSGGALLNDKGEVVGIVEGFLNEDIALLVGNSLPQNVNYAIKAPRLECLLKSCSIKPQNVSSATVLPWSDIYRKAKAATVKILVQE